MKDVVDPTPHRGVKQPERPPLLQVLGPGLITGASDDDPSGSPPIPRPAPSSGSASVG